MTIPAIRLFPGGSGAPGRNLQSEESPRALPAEIRMRQAAEKRLKATFDHAPVGICYAALDGHILEVNDKLCEIGGYTREELLRLNYRDIMHPEDAAEMEANRARLLDDPAAQPMTRERRYIRKDGTAAWISVAASVVRDDDGRPEYFVAVVQDITRRKEAEAHFRATFEQAAVGIAHTSLDRRYLAVNQKFCDMVGYSRDELLGMRSYEITHPDDRDREPNYKQQLLDGRITTYAREKRYVRKDGSVIWVNRTSSLAHDESGNPYFLRVIEDITHRKQAEARFRATFEQAAVGIAHTSLDRRYLAVNQKFCDMVGYSRDELLAMHSDQVAHPDNREPDREKTRQLLDGTLASYTGEKRYVRKDGSVIWVQRTASVAHDENGNPYFIRVVEDITARKEAEDHFHATFQQATVGIAHLSPEGNYLRVNDRFCDMLGYSKDELLAMNAVDITHPDDREAGLARRAGLLSGNVSANCAEKRYIRKDGSVLYTSRATSLVRGPAGEPRYMIGMVTDITDRQLAEQALHETESRLRQIAEHIREVFFLADPSCARSVLYVSPAYEDIWGRSVESLYRNPSSWTDLIHPDDRERALAHVNRGTVTGELDHEYRIVREDGTTRWIRERGFPIRDEAGRLVRIAGIAEDITAFKAAAHALLESDEKFRQLAEHIPQVFWMTDSEQKEVVYVSPAYQRTTGRSLAELQADPRSWQTAVHEEDRERVRRARRLNALSGTYDIEYRVVHTDGTVRWIHDRAFPVRNAQGEIYRIAGIGEDITERKLAEEQLLQLAHYDTLTSLPNRALFNDRLKQTLVQARRNDWTIGVLMLDLDRFKLVNDTLGHACGDKLLQKVSERLAQCLRPGDTAGRLSGDEFAVILSELAAPQDAGLVAQRILNALAQPLDLEGNEVFVSASIGITLFPADSMDTETLLKNADAAMYSAKTLGRSNYQYYTAEMNERATSKIQLESRLRRALEREEFVLHYQPKVNLGTGEIAGLEALLRWQSPENGLVPPDQFVPLLEETGLIIPVGDWVLRAACRQARSWQRAGLPPVPIAVNVAARQLQQKGFCQSLGRMLEEHGCDPRRIEIEITESSLMSDPETAIATLKEIRALGIRLAADDFGTGYSSLGYLKRFPLDALKIDRSFVRDATTDPDSAAITRTLTTLAHSLGLHVVAEGVETEEQLAFLDAIQCDEAQGYLFARPLPAEDCAALLGSGWRPRVTQSAERAGDPLAVLLVDDDPDHLLLGVRLLQKDGHRILTAANTGEAFDLLATRRVGAVVSDERMPDMSGVEFLQRVKRMYPDVARIILSGSGDFRTATAAINLGEVHKYFVKGRDDDLLSGEVRKLLLQKTRARPTA